MDWPATVPDRDVVIVREEGPEFRFAVHDRAGRRCSCRTYAEAEAWALAHAAAVHGCAWYASAGGFQLLGGFSAGSRPPDTGQSQRRPH